MTDNGTVFFKPNRIGPYTLTIRATDICGAFTDQNIVIDSLQCPCEGYVFGGVCKLIQDGDSIDVECVCKNGCSGEKCEDSSNGKSCVSYNIYSQYFWNCLYYIVGACEEFCMYLRVLFTTLWDNLQFVFRGFLGYYKEVDYSVVVAVFWDYLYYLDSALEQFRMCIIIVLMTTRDNLQPLIKGYGEVYIYSQYFWNCLYYIVGACEEFCMYLRVLFTTLWDNLQFVFRGFLGYYKEVDYSVVVAVFWDYLYYLDSALEQFRMCIIIVLMTTRDNLQPLIKGYGEVDYKELTAVFWEYVDYLIIALGNFVINCRVISSVLWSNCLIGLNAFQTFTGIDCEEIITVIYNFVCSGLIAVEVMLGIDFSTIPDLCYRYLHIALTAFEKQCGIDCSKVASAWGTAVVPIIICIILIFICYRKRMVNFAILH